MASPAGYLTPTESARRQFAEQQFFSCTRLCGFSEIRFSEPHAPIEIPQDTPCKFSCLLSPSGPDSRLMLAVFNAGYPAAAAELISAAGDYFAQTGLQGIRIALYPDSSDSPDTALLLKYLDALRLDASPEKAPDDLKDCSFALLCGDTVLCQGRRTPFFAASGYSSFTGCFIRLPALLEEFTRQDVPVPEAPPCDLRLISAGQDESVLAMSLAADLRGEGFYAVSDIAGLSPEEQREAAVSSGTRFIASFAENGQILIENPASGEKKSVNPDSDSISRFLYDMQIDQITDSLDLSALF